MPLRFPSPIQTDEEKYKINDTHNVPQYAIDCIDYAVERYTLRRMGQIAKLNMLYAQYNGVGADTGLEYLNSTYGRENAIKYIDYRLARPKLEKLVGEFIEQPLSATVFTTNNAARTKKLDDYRLMLGMSIAQNKIRQLREDKQIEVMSGMPVPTEEQKNNYWKNVKTENEIIMQYILNNFIRTKRSFKFQLANGKRDVVIVAECHGQCVIRPDGKPDYIEIDPRDAIFEENDRDPFCQQSAYHGKRRTMLKHDVIQTYGLTEAQVASLESGVGAMSDEAYRLGHRSYELIRNGDAFEVFDLQWITLEGQYVILTDTKNSLEGETKNARRISYAEYQKNKEQLDTEAQEGKTTVSVKYKEVLWEATRIGTNLYVNCGPKKGIMGDFENPYSTKTEYVHYLSNTVDGMRISLKELTDNIEKQYNIVRFQINRELSKMKGMQLTYDRAMLPKGKTMKNVLYHMINDAIIDYSSAEEGNIAGETKDPKDAIKAIDLGASSSLQSLLVLAQNLEGMVGKITGITDERTESVSASATVTNSQQAIRNSMSITEPINYGFDIYIEEVLIRIIELTKVSVAAGTMSMENIIGESGVRFIQMTKDVSFDSFGCYLTNARREAEIKDRLRQYGEQSINAAEIRIPDMAKFELAETLGEAIQALEEGWQKIQDVTARQQQADIEAKNKQLEIQAGMMKENREDVQNSELDKIREKGKVQIAVDAAKGKNEHITEIRKTEISGNNAPEKP